MHLLPSMTFFAAFSIALTIAASEQSSLTQVQTVAPAPATNLPPDPEDSPELDPDRPEGDSAFVRFAKSPVGITVFTVGGLFVIALIVAAVIRSAKPDAPTFAHPWQDAKRYTVDGLI
jgi:hypothetical protein